MQPIESVNVTGSRPIVTPPGADPQPAPAGGSVGSSGSLQTVAAFFAEQITQWIGTTATSKSDERMLRMLLALLILVALLERDQKERADVQGMLADLGSRSVNARAVSLESFTMAVHWEQTTVVAANFSAFDAAGSPASNAAEDTPRLDVTG